MIVIGRGQPPQWVWVSAARVQWMRARLAVVGLAVVGAALVFGIVLVAVGLKLPSSRNPINVIGVMIAGLAAFWVLLAGLSLLSARSCAQREHVDVNGARLVRRLLGVWWGGAIFCVLGAWFVEVMTFRRAPVMVGSALYLALLAVIVVLGGVAFFAAGNILRRARV